MHFLTGGNTALSRITLKDIAEHSGYSLRTVKKVMGGKEFVSDETRKYILDAARKLNYRTNRIASALARNRVFTIAAVYADISKYYFPEVEAGINRCMDEYRDFGVRVEYFRKSDLSAEWQKEALSAILERDDIHGVVLKPVGVNQLDSEINRLAEAGKPVVTFGTDAPGSGRMCYIGPDAYKSGRIAAQLLANYIGKKGKVVVIKQTDIMMQMTERARGFKDKMAEEYPSVEVQEVLIPNNPKVYYDIIKSIILHEEGINGIFSTDADVYISAHVLKELNKKDDIVLVGYDLSRETNQFLREGCIKATLYQDPEYQGHMSTKVLCDFLLENRIPDKGIIESEMRIMLSECL